MAQLSPVRAAVPLLDGLRLLHRGKIRDTYELDRELMLVVPSDGVSIFDFVLNALVAGKGSILAAMSHAWFEMLAEQGIRTHFVAYGAAVDAYLPSHLRGNADLLSRAMVVRRLAMHPVEFIARGYLTGSGLAEYRRSGTVCGHQLPPGLQDGDRLPAAIDTPTTKAAEGHDEALDAAAIRLAYPRETELLFRVFAIVSSFAVPRGILFPDTKLEFGLDPEGRTTLGDEVATPDSSRWWDVVVWRERRTAAERKAPPPLDKQLVRAWGIEQGINTLDPSREADVARVHGLPVPRNLLRVTRQTYRYVFWRLFSTTIEEYQRRFGILLPMPRKRVAILFGSESDIAAVKPALQSALHGALRPEFSERPRVHVLSCHRNPAELAEFARSGCGGADVVVAAGGKAFAMPGMLDAWLYAYGQDIPVVGVALGAPDSRSLEAARLSIDELPGQPVVMDEVQGRVYAGPEGFGQALERVARGELPPPKPRPTKPPKFNLDIAASW